MPRTEQYWALPDGISEALPEEASRLEALRRQIIDIFNTWGYQLVMPPLVEYMQSLSAGPGSSLDVHTFKVTDQLSGRMMGIRADMTPQIARIDAHKLANNPVNRLCYIGSVLRTRALQDGDSRAPLQVGAELFGHAGADSDIEVINLLLATLAHCQCGDITLDLGHVGIFRELARQAGFSKQEESTFFDMLQRKSLPEIDHWLNSSELSHDMQAMLAALPRLHGPIAILEQARHTFANASPEVHAAIDYLQELGQRLSHNHPDCILHVDLAELSGYDYHTGIVYGIYQATTGREIARGGRYDGVGKAFGRSRPATGFSTDLRILSQTASNTADQVSKIFAPAKSDPQLNQLIKTLRQQGHCVIHQLDNQRDNEAHAMGCTQIIVHQDGQWVVTDI